MRKLLNGQQMHAEEKLTAPAALGSVQKSWAHFQAVLLLTHLKQREHGGFAVGTESHAGTGLGAFLLKTRQLAAVGRRLAG